MFEQESEAAPSVRLKVHPHRGKILSGERNCVSITPDVKGGRVYYRPSIILKDAFFRVHPSGVARMKETGIRNVHAWIVGEEHDSWIIPIALRSTRARYDFENGRFIDGDEQDITDKTFPFAIIQGANLKVLFP